MTDAERLASLVLMWWSDHECDTDESGEYNVYNEDPPMVVEAKKILTPPIHKCCVCGATENIHNDGWYGWRCNSGDCTASPQTDSEHVQKMLETTELGLLFGIGRFTDESDDAFIDRVQRTIVG